MWPKPPQPAGVSMAFEDPPPPPLLQGHPGAPGRQGAQASAEGRDWVRSLPTGSQDFRDAGCTAL